MKIKFPFNPDKAAEALGVIAREWPGVTPFFVSKVLYFAEKNHVTSYGRPIIGDVYIAMPNGPVPSSVKNFIDDGSDWIEIPQRIEEVVRIDRSGQYPELYPGNRSPDESKFSLTDLQCISDAVGFCKGKSFYELSNISHFEKAWQNAEPNRAMSYEDFPDDDTPNRDDLLREMKENAVYSAY